MADFNNVINSIDTVQDHYKTLVKYNPTKFELLDKFKKHLEEKANKIKEVFKIDRLTFELNDYLNVNNKQLCFLISRSEYESSPLPYLPEKQRDGGFLIAQPIRTISDPIYIHGYINAKWLGTPYPACMRLNNDIDQLYKIVNIGEAIKVSLNDSLGFNYVISFKLKITNPEYRNAVNAKLLWNKICSLDNENEQIKSISKSVLTSSNNKNQTDHNSINYQNPDSSNLDKTISQKDRKKLFTFNKISNLKAKDFVLSATDLPNGPKLVSFDNIQNYLCNNNPALFEKKEDKINLIDKLFSENDSKTLSQKVSALSLNVLENENIMATILAFEFETSAREDYPDIRDKFVKSFNEICDNSNYYTIDKFPVLVFIIPSTDNISKDKIQWAYELAAMKANK